MAHEIIRVLVVDDDQEDAELVADILSEATFALFTTTWADTYEGALEKLETDAFDVCLVDYQLGARSGMDFLKDETVQAYGISVILMTGQGTIELDVEAMRSGAADYLPKRDLTASLLERVVHHSVQRAKRAEDARHIRFQASLLDAVGQAVIATDVEGRVTYWNRAAEEIFGWTQDEVIGRDIVDLAPAAKTRADAQGGMADLRRGQDWKGELELRRKDGSTFPALVTNAPINGEDGTLTGIVGVTSDISERIRMENALRERVKELRTLNAVGYEMNRRNVPLGERLRRVVDTIPGGFRWPEITEARIVLGERSLETEGFGEASDAHRLSAIVRAGATEGEGRLEIVLRGDPPEGSSDPFLPEEQELVSNLARTIGETVARERATHMLSQTFASLEEAVVILDSPGDDRRVRYVNPAAERMFGLSWSEFIGRTPEIAHPSRESFERFGRMAAKELEMGGSFQGTFTLRRKDGTLFQAEQTVSLLDPQRGLDGGIVTVVRDVTRREAAEAALRESEERFRQLAEHINDVFWITSADKRRMEYVSPAYEKVWGRPLQALYGDPSTWTEAILAEDRARIVEAAARQADASYDVNYRIRRPDGSIRWIHDRAFPVENENGEVVRLVGVAEDVTDRRMAEERFRVLGEEMTDVVIVVAPDGRVMFASPSVQWLTGYSAHDLTGRSALELVHQDDLDDVLALLQDLARQPEKTLRAEFRLVRKDGTLRDVESVGRNLRDHPAVRGIVITTRDISERLVLERRLRQVQKMEAVGRLAGGIAHDFNNILTVIRSETELLLLEHENAPIAADLEVIRREADRAATLTSQLLAFSREQVLRPRTVELAEVVRDVSRMTDRVVGERIRVHSDLDREVDPVHIDPDQLQQVVLNLVLNARDSMPGGGTLTISTDLEELDQEDLTDLPGLTSGRYAALRVADTGSGMSQETAARIFDPFFTTKPTGKGTGLGLAMAYGFMKQSGGGIHVETRLGEGSTFSLRFPLSPEPGEDVPAPGAAKASATGSRGGSHRPSAPAMILVVDDEPGVRNVTRRVLERAGFQVVAAGDVGEAVAALDQEGPFDLVLTDLSLPDGDGKDVAGRTGERLPGVPVVLMSGYSERSEQDDLLQHSGISDYLSKPFTRDQLLDAVRSTLEGRSGS
ncbi:MAG: PAS domain S-box protein [Gemmatimonadota bacterium]